MAPGTLVDGSPIDSVTCRLVYGGPVFGGVSNVTHFRDIFIRHSFLYQEYVYSFQFITGSETIYTPISPSASPSSLVTTAIVPPTSLVTMSRMATSSQVGGGSFSTAISTTPILLTSAIAAPVYSYSGTTGQTTTTRSNLTPLLSALPTGTVPMGTSYFQLGGSHYSQPALGTPRPFWPTLPGATLPVLSTTITTPTTQPPTTASAALGAPPSSAAVGGMFMGHTESASDPTVSDTDFYS